METVGLLLDYHCFVVQETFNITNGQKRQFGKSLRKENTFPYIF